MRVYIAGAGGVIGRHLVPRLVARGHHVTATTRSAEKLALLRGLGAEAVVVDGLDAGAVRDAVARARPDAMVHQMTSISGAPDLKRFDRWFAPTNRLRTTGTTHLLAAASSNAKAGRDLDWRPASSSWRDGFRRGLTAPVDGASARESA